MGHDWKPGDLAVRVGRDGEESLAVCASGCRSHTEDRRHWHTYRDGRPDWDTLTYSGVTYRPLVVIDLEDGEQVDRLVRLFWDHANEVGGDAAAMREALREFAAPTSPRPDEPTGLGAVVEDSGDVKWIGIGNGLWVPHARAIGYPADEPPRAYNYIDAVRVHGEGVQPC